MKYFFRVALMVLALLVGSVRADIITSFRQITADSGHAESPFVEYVPAGYSSWAMEVTTGEDASWLGTLMRLRLSEGSIYYHPFGEPDRTPPNAALFVITDFEPLRFSSYVAAPTTNTAPLGQRRSPGVIPDPVSVVRQNKQWDAQIFVTGWAEYDPGGSNSVPGTHVIGVFTVSNDAQGDIDFGISVDRDSASGGIDYSNWFVRDGAFAFTDPPPRPPPPRPTTRQPIFIAGTSFEDPPLGAVEHTALTGDEIGFTRRFLGMGATGVVGGSPANPPFTNGEQAYYSLPHSGGIELNFDVVSWNSAKIQDVEITIDVWLPDRLYEEGDFLRIRAEVSHGDLTDSLTLLDVSGVDINAGELTKGEWNSLQLKIADEWQQAALQIFSTIDAPIAGEFFMFDNVGFAGAPHAPEPSSFLLAVFGVLGLFCRIGRRRTRDRG
ncbi:MAG: hypothetical protein IID44_21370 [Planctomycetes bacterium]|nr:hypothetical protein [Planctomycetota bacterium]